MIYVIQGEEEYFIREKIDELSSSAKGEIVRYNGSDKDFSIPLMLDSCLSNTLFSDQVSVFVQDPYFLINKLEDKELKPLFDYVDHPLYETDLILYTYGNSFNQRLKSYKHVAGNAQIFDLKALKSADFNAYVRTAIKETGIDISNEAVWQLIGICKRSVSLFRNNLEILKLYPGRIDTKAIDRLCSTSGDNDAFDLINAITARNISEAVRIERKMLNETDSALSLAGLLASQLRFLYHVAYLNKEGKSRSEIMSLTHSADFRISKANETLSRLDMSQIMHLLHQLSDLDCLSKSDSSVSDRSRFEMFILRLLKRSDYAGD